MTLLSRVSEALIYMSRATQQSRYTTSEQPIIVYYTEQAKVLLIFMQRTALPGAVEMCTEPQTRGLALINAIPIEQLTLLAYISSFYLININNFVQIPSK